jgi:hypothetical protein
VGRVSVAAPQGTSLEADPISHLVKKAHDVDFEDPYALTQDEKDALVGFWNATFWGDPNAVVAESKKR